MSDSFRADIDQLNQLSAKLRGLAQTTGQVRCGKGAVEAFNTGKPGGVMSSHEAAVAITKNVLHGALIEGAKARLEAVADAMSTTSKAYQARDERSRDELVAALRRSTGAWTSGAAE